ncbi:MAG: sigma-E factor negative regulatory protein [Acidiferrobacterales bacterium]
MKEKLSALLDGELETSELAQTVKQIANEPPMRETWGRYHLIRDVMRRQLDSLAPPGLADTISLRLQSEPSILVPRRRSDFKANATRWVAGVAVAASVAAVAIVGVRWFAPNQSNVPQLVAQSVESADYLRSSGIRWQAVSKDVEHDLNMFLVQHSEFAPTTGMNGVMSYVRFVGYDTQ